MRELVCSSVQWHTRQYSISDTLELELAGISVSLHDPSPIQSECLTRFLRNRVQPFRMRGRLTCRLRKTLVTVTARMIYSMRSSGRSAVQWEIAQLNREVIKLKAERDLR